MNIGQPSIDHLRIFLAVAEEGSFNRAAKRMGRAISVVSYAITNLEAQLGLTLFDREGSRSPRLTDAGRAVRSQAHAVTLDVDTLLAKVRALHQGLEPELSLVVDVMVPGEALAQVLRDFQRTFPSVTLRLHIEAMGAVAALVLDGRAGIGIGGPVIADCGDMEREAVGAVDLVPVCAPSHPLASLHPIAPGEARDHLQLVLSDRSELTAGREFSVIGGDTWRLADLSAKHVLLREGLGWGNMPSWLIADDLVSGALVALTVPEAPSLSYALSALWRRDVSPGPAARWTLDAFRTRLCPAAPALAATPAAA